MSIENLQSQIEIIRQKKITLGKRNGKTALQDYNALIESLEEMAVFTAQELDRAHTEIEAERQSFQNFFRFTEEGYFVSDLEGIIREANSGSASLLGIASHELIGKSLDSFVRVKERAEFGVHRASISKAVNFHQWETVLIRDPHQELNVAVKVSAIHNHGGDVSGLRWLIRDVTQHQRTEENLRRNTGQLLVSQQAGHVGSWEWDVIGDEVIWSDEMYRIYGLEPQSVEITYEGFLALVHPEDQARLRSVIENAFETQQPFSFDHRILQPNGAVRHLHSHGIILPGETGQTERMLGTGQDITEQKQAEEELHRLNFELEQRVERRTSELSNTNERLKKIVVERAQNQESIQQLNRELNRRVAELQTVLSVLPVGVTVAYDPQAVYITTNSTGQQILGVSRSENTPSDDHGVASFKAMRGKMELPREENPLILAMEKNITIREAEVDLQYQDGTTINVLSYAAPLYDEQEQVRGGVAAFIDITKRRVVEKRLALQYAVARTLAESKEIREASLKILDIICREMDWDLGIFWCFNRDVNKLYVENTWQKPGMPQTILSEVSRDLFPEPGESLPGSVYLTNEPLWLSDFADQPNFPHRSVVRESGFTGLVSFPLRRGEEEVLGVMEFFGHKVPSPTPELIDMFNALSSQMGEFMGRQYAEELRAIQVEQQSVISKLSQQALLSTDLEVLLNETCAQIAQTLSVEFSHVLELIPEQKRMLFRAGAGWEEGVMRSSVDLVANSQFLYVLSDNQPISIDDFGSENRFQVEPVLVEHGVVSGMSVVISGRSHTFGLLEAYSTKRRMFTRDDIHFLQGVAHLLAAAIQHHEVEEALRLSRNQISIILDGIADGITAQNRQGKLIYANDTAARVIGYANADELMTAPVEGILTRFKIFDESGVPLSLDRLPNRLALQGESSLPLTMRYRVLNTGEERWSVVKAKSVKNDAGQVVMAVNIFHDITDLKRSELAQRLLAQTSAVLANDLDYQTRMNNLAKILVPSFADWCAIDILDEDKKLRRLAVFHIDPQMVEWAHEIHERFPPDPNASSGAYKVIRTNQAEYAPVIPQEMIDAISDPERRELVQKLGLASFIVAPLSARGHTFGTLSLIWAESDHHYSSDDLILAEEVARRAALALENARLYEEAQSSNAELEERVNTRTVQLQKINARLVGEVNERKLIEEQFRRLNMELEERVVERAGQLQIANEKLQREIFERELADEALLSSLQKTRELYQISQTMGLVNTPDELLHVLLSGSYLTSAVRASVAIFDRIWQKEDEAPPASCTILLAWNKQPETLLYIGQEMSLDEYGLIEPYSRNEPVIIPDIRDHSHVNEAMRKRLTNMGVASSIIFPLVAVGHWYGLLSLHFKDVVNFSTEDIRHLEGLVDEVAMGIYNFRLLEAEANARREAEDANKLKLNFLAMISHELRTPLTSIKGFSTTLLADDVEWKPENQRDFIETINSEADKLTELIEQLLNISSLESGTIKITPRRVEWNQILLTSLAQVKALTVDHQLVIKETEPDFPILKIDVMRISQVVTNLVTNAVRYSPKDTTIIISAEKLSDKFIKVCVIDEGIGIPLEARTRVFEAFQQLEREKGGTQGAGLGLSICHGLIEAHGGRIWVDDHTGPGTTMAFTLPIAD